MPTYLYECRECGYQEDHICRISDRPEVLPCPVRFCVGLMRQVITPVLIQADSITDTPWLKEFAKNHNRQGGKRDRFGDKPIESRTDYKRYLERHDLRPTRGENLSEV